MELLIALIPALPLAGSCSRCCWDRAWIASLHGHDEHGTDGTARRHPRRADAHDARCQRFR